MPFKKAELLERQVSLNRHLAYTLRVQTRCSSKCNLKNKKPPARVLAQTSPALEPLPLAFCQLPIVSDFIICPKDDGGGKHRAASRCVYVLQSYSHLGDIGGRNENTDGSAPAFGKCPAFLGFKQLVMDPGRVHKLLGTSMKANFFFGRKCSMHQTVLLGTRKFDQSA